MKWLEDKWYGKPGWLFILLPVTFLYQFVMMVRRWCYRLSVFKTTKLPVPIIVVGNLTVGGTGKTPLVIHLVKQLQEQGKTVGVISRGYGVNNITPKIINKQSVAAEVGDEPLLIFKKTNCVVCVCKDRVLAAKTLLQKQPKCEVIVSDDGLQHLALERDYEIAVVDGLRQFGNGWCLPVGPLREPLSRLKSVDSIVVNQANKEAANHRLLADCIQMKLMPTSLKPLNHQNKALPQKGKVHAVCAIGNPARFFDTLTLMGFEVIEHAYPDHQLIQFEALEFSDELPIIITEKDAVKLPLVKNDHIWVLPVEAEVDIKMPVNLFR